MSNFESEMLDGWISWHGDMPRDEIPEPNISYVRGFTLGLKSRQTEIDRLKTQLRCAKHGHRYHISLDGGTLVCECGACMRLPERN